MKLNDPTLFREAALVGERWLDADPSNAVEVNNPATGEIIGHVAHLVRTRGTMGDLSATIFPYPTIAEGLRKAGDAYRRQSLTPRVKRAFDTYFSLFRR